MVKKAIVEKIGCKGGCGGGSGNAIYGLGLIGSLVYVFQHYSSAGDIFWGILKSIVWPAILAYKAIQQLGF